MSDAWNAAFTRRDQLIDYLVDQVDSYTDDPHIRDALDSIAESLMRDGWITE